MVMWRRCLCADKLAVVGRRPRSDEYNPTAGMHAAANSSAVGVVDSRLKEQAHSRPHHPQHYSDFVQVTNI